MKYTLKKLSATRIKLTINVSKDELDNAEKAAVGRLAKNVKVPGFRKGNVPLNVATKHIDANLLNSQTLENAISRAMSDAYTEAGERALAQPQVEIKKYIPKQELEFTAESDVLPEVKLGDYKKLKTKKEVNPVEASEVNEVIERLQENLASTKSVKRAAKKGDEVVIDFVGKRDGKPFEGGTSNDYNLKLGSGQFIPGFEEAIEGKKAGEEFVIPLTFPKDYHVSELQNAKVEFEVKLKTVNERELPKADDELAKKVGAFKTLKELKDDIRKEFIERNESEAIERHKDEIVKELVEISDVPVPQVFLDDQARSIEQDFLRNLAYQGISLESYLNANKLKSEDDWRKKEVHPIAEKRVKSGLVLAELAKIFAVDATEEEIDNHVDLYKKSYANDKDSQKRLDTTEARQDIANRLLTEKTVDKLIEINSK